MRTYWIAQGTVLNDLQCVKWERNPKNREIYIYVYTHTSITGSCCCIAETNTIL